MNKDQLLISRIEDAIERAGRGFYATSTRFLDAHEQSVADKAIKNGLSEVRALYYGGYGDAERRLLAFIPNDSGMGDEDACAGLVQVLHISIPKGSKPLNHRDYLGSALSLGIDRSMIGDILVREDGVDMLIVPEIAGFLISNYVQVAHTDIKCEIRDICELIIPESRTQIIKDTVPSVRLDNIIASAFKLSRSSSVTAIKSGLVSINHVENIKPDFRVEAGDVLVLRGRGKAKIVEIGGASKKGRVWVSIAKYVGCVIMVSSIVIRRCRNDETINLRRLRSCDGMFRRL